MVKSVFNTSCDIWLFRNIQTSQVVVSPSKVMLNRRSMAQLPPNRRLHPTALRKDHWVPLLKASFSNPAVMGRIYSRLLEYRQWRTEAPTPEDQLAMRIKARRRLQIDQVATSIADLSASCEVFEKSPITITWLNEIDKGYAKEWPTTVTHQAGIDVKRGWEVVEFDPTLEAESSEPVNTSAQ